MPFWVFYLIIVLWWAHVKSGPTIQVKNKGVYLDAQTTLQPMEEDPEITEELNSTLPVAEGDILLNEDRNAVTSIWRKTLIPYVIAYELSGRTPDILKAMKMISNNSCVTFHQRTSEKNFLFFREGRGCASYVGCIHGEQPIYLNDHCGVGNIAHELLHALGFYHEHTRMDRDDYIVVLEENVKKGKMKNFLKRPGNTLNVGYDVKSIMHYKRTTFSVNGSPTIIPLKREKGFKMGQRDKLTKSDSQKLRLLYSCDGPRKKHAAKSGEV